MKHCSGLEKVEQRQMKSYIIQLHGEIIELAHLGTMKTLLKIK